MSLYVIDIKISVMLYQNIMVSKFPLYMVFVPSTREQRNIEYIVLLNPYLFAYN